MRRIAEKFYQLEAGGFVNAYLIEGTEDLTLVDTGHSRCAQRLLDEIKDNGYSLKDIGRVVLTHAHADHVGGVSALREDHVMRIYAHPDEIEVLKGNAPPPAFTSLKGFWLEFAHEQLLPWPPIDTVMPAVPGTPLSGIPQWQIFHTPGHTNGSLALFHPVRQILVCGDVLSNHGGTLHIPDDCFNQDSAVLRESASRLAALDCDILCCGHGPVLRGGAFRHIEKVLAV